MDGDVQEERALEVEHRDRGAVRGVRDGEPGSGAPAAEVGRAEHARRSLEDRYEVALAPDVVAES